MKFSRSVSSGVSFHFWTWLLPHGHRGHARLWRPRGPSAGALHPPGPTRQTAGSKGDREMTPTSDCGARLPTTTGPTHPQRGHVPAFAASTGPSPNHGRHRWPSPGCACGNGRWHRTEWGRGRAEPLLLALEGRRDRAGPTPPGLPGGLRGAPVPQHRTAAHTPCRPSPCPLALWVGVPVSECAGTPGRTVPPTGGRFRH